MKNTREKLEEIRATAERLIVGTPEGRWARGLVVELCGALLGEDVKHPDIESCGARYPAPNFAGSMPAPPVAGLAATPAGVAPPGAPGSPASPLRRPGPPLSLADGMAIAAARRSPAPAPTAAAVDTNGAADPAGPNYLKELEQRLAAEDSDPETGT